MTNFQRFFWQGHSNLGIIFLQFTTNKMTQVWNWRYVLQFEPFYLNKKARVWKLLENSVWLAWHYTYATYYSAGFWPNINPLWPEYNFLPKILNTKLNIIRCLFVVCFKGGMSTRAFLGFPLCLTDVSVFKLTFIHPHHFLGTGQSCRAAVLVGRQ